MSTISAGILLMRWPLISAILMFIASTLNLQFRKFNFRLLTMISNVSGLAAALWFATNLLGLTQNDVIEIGASLISTLTGAMNHMQPEWPIIIT